VNDPCLSDEEREAALRLKAHCPKITSDKEESDTRVARWLNQVNAEMKSLGIHTEHSRGRLFCEIAGVFDVVAQSVTPTCNSWIIVSRQTGKPLMETYDKTVVDVVNRERYEVLSAYQWLVRLNKQLRST
jgi:hypothetical protein